MIARVSYKHGMIIIKRRMGYSQIPVHRTISTTRAIKMTIVNLTNLGYHVIVEGE